MRIAHAMASLSPDNNGEHVISGTFIATISPPPPPPFLLEDYSIIMQARYLMDGATPICFSSGGVLTEAVLDKQLFINTISMPDAESDSYYKEFLAAATAEDPVLSLRETERWCVAPLRDWRTCASWGRSLGRRIRERGSLRHIRTLMRSALSIHHPIVRS
jgi:hypothetical protein